MDVVKVPLAHMNWDASNLHKVWRKFKLHDDVMSKKQRECQLLTLLGRR